MSYNTECVLTEVVVKPKNTVMKSKHAYNTLFYNIKTGQVQEPFGFSKNCDWIEELDEKHLMVTEDIMYINFIKDVSNVKKGYCGTVEMIREDIGYGEIGNDFGNVWNIVKDDFKDILSEENKDLSKSMTYLMMISVHSTYCSYMGDGDVYLGIEGVVKVNGSQFVETKIEKKEYFPYI